MRHFGSQSDLKVDVQSNIKSANIMFPMLILFPSIGLNNSCSPRYIKIPNIRAWAIKCFFNPICLLPLVLAFSNGYVGHLGVLLHALDNSWQLPHGSLGHMSFSHTCDFSLAPKSHLNVWAFFSSFLGPLWAADCWLLFLHGLTSFVNVKGLHCNHSALVPLVFPLHHLLLTDGADRPF